ncbi:MAG: aspartate aminotransferase family protein [Chloroflexota bacterium]|nr:aminotransferase class III-fold pyridoxal phosphate-dependent enzyme [Chloroflexota bacterium]NOG63857.1 aminotransferase class III-fold pyridoxal phosphate-dependent enzyme [Chloroflexota bacterium]GIK63967.1 MAG: aspartate aminotransferase family protein [Chloroflexota bacterium]
MSLQNLSPAWSHLTEIVVDHAEGIYLYDVQGNRYIDFTSGIGVTSTGHCHPNVVKAIQEQASKLIFAQVNCAIPPQTLELADTLLPLMPKGIDCFFFSNSGAEAIEGAVKLAKTATGRPNVIAFQGSFHGRTALAMALTGSKTTYRAGYQPLPAGVFFAPFPYAYRYGWSEDEAVDFCLRELDLLLHTQTAPHETAAILIEPVLGEGGYVPAPPRFLQALRHICDEHGMLLILDEIQSGFGRTGEFWAHTRSGITPDVLIMAKGIASGMPMSAIAAPRKLMEKWQVGAHGGTYGGGNAVVMAAAIATVKTIQQENLVANAREMGEYLKDGLTELQGRFPVIGDVRGWGLMVATEFVQDGQPSADLAKAISKASLERNLMLLTCGSYANVIRWIPPLVVNRGQIDDALHIFNDALESVLS